VKAGCQALLSSCGSTEFKEVVVLVPSYSPTLWGCRPKHRKRSLEVRLRPDGVPVLKFGGVVAMILAHLVLRLGVLQLHPSAHVLERREQLLVDALSVFSHCDVVLVEGEGGLAAAALLGGAHQPRDLGSGANVLGAGRAAVYILFFKLFAIEKQQLSHARPVS
jgi:hypothetical protein